MAIYWRARLANDHSSPVGRDSRDRQYHGMAMHDRVNAEAKVTSHCTTSWNPCIHPCSNWICIIMTTRIPRPPWCDPFYLYEPTDYTAYIRTSYAVIVISDHCNTVTVWAEATRFYRCSLMVKHHPSGWRKEKETSWTWYQTATDNPPAWLTQLTLLPQQCCVAHSWATGCCISFIK